MPNDNPQPTTPLLMRSVRLGEDGALMAGNVGAGGGVFTPSGIIVSPGTYLHRDDVESAILAYADQHADTVNEGVARDALRSIARYLRMQGV